MFIRSLVVLFSFFFYFFSIFFCFFFFCFLFFFQAEDGIRDLVRSRGLGDVYKRQVRFAPNPFMGVTILTIKTLMAEEAEVVFRDNRGTKISTRIHSLEKGTNNITLSEWDNIPSGVYHVTAVSYTHLTLPTSDLV